MADATAQNPLADFAASGEKPEASKPSYVPTHATVKLSDRVSATGCKRESDGVPHVAITRTIGTGDDAREKTTYDRADRVAQYLQKLAEMNESKGA
jgi:hypothetical protein